LPNLTMPLQGMHLNFVQHGLHYLAGALDQIDDRKQDLASGPTARNMRPQ
jgi:hypothetical protein